MTIEEAKAINGPKVDALSQDVAYYDFVRSTAGSHISQEALDYSYAQKTQAEVALAFEEEIREWLAAAR